jgi:hypothetical protein
MQHVCTYAVTTGNKYKPVRKKRVNRKDKRKNRNEPETAVSAERAEIKTKIFYIH